MKRLLLLGWFGVLGLSLVAGCSHSRSAGVSNNTSTPVACARCGCPKSQCQGAVACAGCARNKPIYTSSASVPSPVTQVAAKETQPTQPVLPEPAMKSTFTRGEPAPARKSYVDITASSCFNHSPDYSTISGQLTLSRATNTWRLRYLSVDEADAYGGSVTLTGDSEQAGSAQGWAVCQSGRPTEGPGGKEHRRRPTVWCRSRPWAPPTKRYLICSSGGAQFPVGLERRSACEEGPSRRSTMPIRRWRYPARS